MSVVRGDSIHSLREHGGDDGIDWQEGTLQLQGWDESGDPAHVRRDTEDHLGFLVNQTTSVRPQAACTRSLRPLDCLTPASRNVATPPWRQAYSCMYVKVE